ncbi:MAG: hypothetical protein K9K21_07465 [Desulfotignum sp.]|nr:hypothetical protein [Desulfotignum sp.]
MTPENDKQPPCFGNLEKVFPMQENGLRRTPEDCFYHCPVKTRCLRHAMATKDGVKVEEELIDRSEQAGIMNFFERWSRKKQVHRRIRTREKKED